MQGHVGQGLRASSQAGVTQTSFAMAMAAMGSWLRQEGALGRQGTKEVEHRGLGR